MSIKMLGLEHGLPMPELDAIKDWEPDRIVAELERRGLLDQTASAVLRQHLRLRILSFRFHPIRCVNPPLSKRDIGGAFPWQRVGNLFLWVQLGKWHEHLGTASLDGDGIPDALCCEFCLAAD